ncbi:hypothetical protein M5689_008489 [Euphorbia peplus]|nr:hypothetical protein M5689_008489 [Euphorbia peplus]
MVHEATNPTHSIDREVRDMVNAITSRVSDLQKPAGASHHHHHHHRQEVEEDESGVRIVTLAGTNTGATMRTELDEKSNNSFKGISSGHESDDASGTYVNSNFQAVNNSIMLGSNYNTNDPGVHLDISDLFDHHHPYPHKSAGKKGKKNKDNKKDKEPFKSDHSN